MADILEKDHEIIYSKFKEMILKQLNRDKEVVPTYLFIFKDNIVIAPLIGTSFNTHKKEIAKTFVEKFKTDTGFPEVIYLATEAYVTKAEFTEPSKRAEFLAMGTDERKKAYPTQNVLMFNKETEDEFSLEYYGIIRDDTENNIVISPEPLMSNVTSRDSIDILANNLTNLLKYKNEV